MRVVELVLFTVSLLVSGLVTFALLWSGPDPYRDVANSNGVTDIEFVQANGGTAHFSANAAAFGPHAAWSRYVTGADATRPTFEGPFFTEDEYAHMADVRHVFDGAKALAVAGVLVIIVRLQRSRARSARDMWWLLRAGSLAAAVTVIALGVLAVVAFEPMFLLFHYLFFPQGNFLFGPDSNLIRLYPDWYWEGITLRVGLSFIALSLALAAIAHLRLVRRLA